MKVVVPARDPNKLPEKRSNAVMVSSGLPRRPINHEKLRLAAFEEYELDKI